MSNYRNNFHKPSEIDDRIDTNLLSSEKLLRFQNIHLRKVYKQKIALPRKLLSNAQGEERVRTHKSAFDKLSGK